MKKRLSYDIYASMPVRKSNIEHEQFLKVCDQLSIKTIESDNEKNRIDKIIKNEFSIIIIGNIGQLNKLVSDRTLVVMVYHGIGLKNSYYTDINDRINLRSVEAEERFRRLEKDGHSNLVLTGFTKLDRLHDLEVINILKMKEQLGQKLN